MIATDLVLALRNSVPSQLRVLLGRPAAQAHHLPPGGGGEGGEAQPGAGLTLGVRPDDQLLGGLGVWQVDQAGVALHAVV